MTYTQILNSVLNNIPNHLDKSQASIIYNAVSPICLELSKLYSHIQGLNEVLFIDTSYGEYLDKLGLMFGFTRNLKTKSIWECTSLNALSEGMRFKTANSTYFTVDAVLDDDTYTLICDEYGSKGNFIGQSLTNTMDASKVIDFDDLKLIVHGRNTETDEEFRTRFLTAVKRPPFGGNAQDYRERINLVCDAAAIKVFNCYQGEGSVGIMLLDENYNIPDDDNLKNLVQNSLYPPDKNGIAPIGHIVYVLYPTAVNINVSFELELNSNVNEDVVMESIKENINNYLLNLKKGWQESEAITVRITQIELAILHTDGVLDIDNLKINLGTSNIVLDDDEVPFLGTVTNN